MASTSTFDNAPSISFWHHATRAIETRGQLDIWLLGITLVVGGQSIGWSVGLSAGLGGMLLSTILMGTAYVCFCCCVGEVTGALPFAGGSYGLARCTLGFFPAFLIGCCEAIEYIGVIATVMTAIAAMVVQIAPQCAGYELVIMFVLYASMVCLQLLGRDSFWVGSFVLGMSGVGVWFLFFFSSVGHTDFPVNVQQDGSAFFGGGSSELFRVFPFAAWFFIGIEVLNLASDDVVHPKSTIPRAQTLCALFIVLMSLATVLVTVSLPHPDQLITDLAMNPVPLNPGFNLGLGLSNNTATALAIHAQYAGAFGFVWSYTKLLQSMASSKLLPPILAAKTVRTGRPYMAMIAGMTVSYVVCVVVFYNPTWAGYVLSVGLLFAFMSYTGQCVGYISLKYKYLDTHPSRFKSPSGVAGAMYAIIIWVVGFGCIVLCQGNGGTEIAVFCGIVVVLAAYYHLYSKRRQTFSAQESKILLAAYVMKFNTKRTKQIWVLPAPIFGNREWSSGQSRTSTNRPSPSSRKP